MAERWRIKKGDRVVVTTGRHKGRVGEILRVLREDHRIVVQGVNVVRRHIRPSAQNPDGVVQKEMSIHVSNVMHIDPETSKPTRVGVKILDDGRKVRYAKTSGKILDI